MALGEGKGTQGQGEGGPKLALVARLSGTQKKNQTRLGRRRVVESVWELALNVDAAKGKAPQKKIIDT